MIFTINIAPVVANIVFPNDDIRARIDGTASMQYPDGVLQNPGRIVSCPKTNPAVIRTPPSTSRADFSEALLPSRVSFGCPIRVRSRNVSGIRAIQPTHNSANEVIPHQVVGASNQNANFPKGSPRVAATHKYATMSATAIEMVVKG